MAFDERYLKAMKQIDGILRNDTEHNSLKKFIESYKIDKMMMEREEKKIEESMLQYGVVDRSLLRQRKQIVGLAEIKEHEKVYSKAKYEKIALREISRMKERERWNEHNSRIENEMKLTRKRLGSYEKKNSKEKEAANQLIHSNNIKKKEFNDFVNKLNIERIQSTKHPSPNQCKVISKPTPIPLPHPIEMGRSKVSHSQQNKKRVIIPLKKSISRDNSSKEKRAVATSPPAEKPIEKPKKKDYIREGLKFAKLHKGNKLHALSENLKFTNNDDFANNLDTLKFKARKYEDLAKKQELLIKVNGGAKNNINACEKASNYLLDSIIAKISLLKQISSD